MTLTARSGPARGSPSSPACWTCPSWPKGMRVIVRKERPHPGAQLRFTDIDGHRFTCFATSTRGGQLADLELRHRRRARCEDRIRCAKDTGLRNLPLHGYAQNKIWCEIVALACELLAWTQMLALTGPGPPLGTQAAPAADLLPPPGASSAAAGACGSASLPDGPGPPTSPPESPAPGPRHLADQPQASQRPGRRTPAGHVEPRTPGATAGLTSTDRQPETAPSRSLRPPIQDHERSRLALPTWRRMERGFTTSATSTSQLIAANLNPKVIQARPGHATVGETMDTYGHLFRTPMTSGSGPLTMRRRRASQHVGRVL